MRRLCARILMVIVGATALLASSTSMASAAGDAEANALIVTDALPGWERLPESAIERTVAVERSAVGVVTDRNFLVAVEGWERGVQSLVVVLISFPDGDPPDDFKPRDAVVGACGAATRTTPKSLHTYAPIAGSTEAMCIGKTPAGDEVAAAVMSWQKESVFAIVIGNEFSFPQLEQFAVTQDAALPGPAPAQLDDDSDSESSNTELFVVIAVIVVLGAAAMFLLIARSRSRAPAPVQALGGSPGAASPPWASPQPGWQPVAGDPARIAYWDGSQFTAWKRWDGSNWVD